MWKTALKFLAIFVLKNRMQFLKSQFFNKLHTNAYDSFNKPNLYRLKDNIAAMAETRAAIFKQNFNHEINRVVKSLIGFMLILLFAILSLLTGLMWLFATAWTSPHRDIILGVTMLIPIALAIGVYLAIRNSWQKQPILHQSMQQIESDWQVFKAGFDTTADANDDLASKDNL
ncbi:MAG: phage holin family protein [Bdellovibrio sp.]|nr:phage holin family protein [Methylotenera sp.]